MILFGLAGRRRVGKDTFAQMASAILAKQSVAVKKFAFADSLKDFCRDYLNVPEENMYGNDVQKESPIGHETDFFNPEASELFDCMGNSSDTISARRILQIVGTNIFRKVFRNDIWINGVWNKIKQYTHDHTVVIISDVRFYNEVKFIHQHSGQVVKIYRDTGLPNQSHASESELDTVPDSEFDHIITKEDNSTMQGLENRVREILVQTGVLQNA